MCTQAESDVLGTGTGYRVLCRHDRALPNSASPGRPFGMPPYYIGRKRNLITYYMPRDPANDRGHSVDVQACPVGA